MTFKTIKRVIQEDESTNLDLGKKKILLYYFNTKYTIIIVNFCWEKNGPLFAAERVAAIKNGGISDARA